MARRLRSGYTTGACAAAAAKAAVLLLMGRSRPERVEIPFPDGSRHAFAVHRCEAKPGQAWASVLKDAGDDPDVTNGAEIKASVSFLPRGPPLPPSLGGGGERGKQRKPRNILPSSPTPVEGGELNGVRLEQTKSSSAAGQGLAG
jgi:cobalt-precorrin-5B (C1)-methyltransferase